MCESVRNCAEHLRRSEHLHVKMPSHKNLKPEDAAKLAGVLVEIADDRVKAIEELTRAVRTDMFFFGCYVSRQQSHCRPPLHGFLLTLADDCPLQSGSFSSTPQSGWTSQRSLGDVCKGLKYSKVKVALLRANEPARKCHEKVGFREYDSRASRPLIFH